MSWFVRLSSVVTVLLGCSFVALLGCSDDTKSRADSALRDAARAADGPRIADAGADRTVAFDASADRNVADSRPDAVVPDAAAPSCNPALDISPLSLDPSYCVVHRMALPARPAAVGFSPGKVWGMELSSTKPQQGTVFFYAFDHATVDLENPTPVFSFSPTVTGTLYAGMYLALAPAGAAAVGYTAGGTNDGEVFFGQPKQTAPQAIAKATGNFDAAFFDDRTLLVNGLGLAQAQAGQGVYAYRAGETPFRLISKLLDSSSNLAVGPEVVVAGGYSSDRTNGGNRLYAFGRGELKGALSARCTVAADVAGDEVFRGGVADATILAPPAGEEQLVLSTMDASYQFAGVIALPLTLSKDAVHAGAPVTVVPPSKSPGVSVDAVTAAGSELLVLISSKTKSEVVVLRRR